jgi:hypothetical protein
MGRRGGTRREGARGKESIERELGRKENERK